MSAATVLNAPMPQQVREDFASMVGAGVGTLVQGAGDAELLPVFPTTLPQRTLPPANRVNCGGSLLAQGASADFAQGAGRSPWPQEAPVEPYGARMQDADPGLLRQSLLSGLWPAPAPATPWSQANAVKLPSPAFVAAPPAQMPPQAYPCADKPHKDFATSVLTGSHMHHFPTTLTLLLCILFVFPIMVTYNIGQDLQVKYWISEHLWVVLILPCLFAGAHFVHVIRGRPSRVLAVLCTIGACALILYCADVVLMGANQIASMMEAKDCNTFEKKRHLEEEWQSARLFYNECMKSTAADYNKSISQATAFYRIQDCTGYKEELANHPQWAYLAATEEQNLCSGWCTVGERLWTYHNTKDSCSVTVSQHMVDLVQPTMWKVAVYTLICFVCASFKLLTIGSFLHRHGIEW